MIKVLQICNKPPLPKIDGGCVAINNISEGLMDREDIKLKILTVETEKHPFIKENYPKKYTKNCDVEAVFIDTRVNFVEAYSSFITSDSYNVIRFFSPSFDKRLAEILQEEEFDIVHIESIFITPYIHTIKKYSNAKIVLRAHNVEYTLWKGKEDETINIIKKLYMKHLHKTLKKYESNVLNDVDAIATISPIDNDTIQSITDKPTAIIPLGIETTNLKSKKLVEPVKLFHIGAMDWKHNKEGVDWFIEKIWPKILAEIPDCEFHLAGKNISKDYHLPKQNIFCHGEVENAKDFFEKHDILVIPLKTASGLRIKIIESFNFGKPVITTKVGIKGIEATNKREYIEANNSKEFIEAIKFLQQQDNYNSIRSNAHNFVNKHYCKTSVISNLVNFYKSLL